MSIISLHEVVLPVFGSVLVAGPLEEVLGEQIVVGVVFFVLFLLPFQGLLLLLFSL